MSVIDDRYAAMAALEDPYTTEEDLLAITTHHRDLWVEVARHPNTYPGLLDYLSQYGDDAVREAIAQRGMEPATQVMSPEATTTVATPGPSFTDDPTTVMGDPTKVMSPDGSPSWGSSPDDDKPLPGIGLDRVDDSDDDASRKKRMILLASIGGGVVGLAAIALAVIFLIVQPRMLNNEYDTTFAAFVGAQNDLAEAISDATDSFEITEADKVKDPEVHEALPDAIEVAKTFISMPDEKAGTKKEIREQITAMSEETATVVQATETLVAATGKVDESRREFFGEALQEAIDAAQKILDDSEGLVSDETVRTSLAEAITTATQTHASLSVMERQAMIDTVESNIATLKDAGASVSSGQLTKCQSGVYIPHGVDEIVCEGMPRGATNPKVNGQYATYVQFSLPNGKIGCTADAYATGMVMCESTEKTWVLPKDVTPPEPVTGGTVEPVIMDGKVSGQWHSDVAPWGSSRAEGLTIPTLKDGQVANMGAIACRSQDGAVLCWDVSTHHGFLMSTTDFIYW
ncbi:MAG: hypothetical protein FWG08_04905 [Propionibacteriaceae bacterium]|nr:hypothetical protein [Propionibacteriaceae bacterium]